MTAGTGGGADAGAAEDAADGDADADADADSGEGETDGAGADGDDQEACVPGTVSTSRSYLRSLTRVQYLFATRDLLGLDVATNENLALLDVFTDGEQAGYSSNTQGFDEETARRYLTLAEGLAADYATLVLPDALQCDWSETSCAQELLDGFGRRVFRRPLEASERDDYLGIYTGIRDEYSAQEAMETLVAALLTAPEFIYLEEPVQALPTGDEDKVVELTPYALASRLSFFLWNGIPDDALLDAAEDGTLGDPAGVEAQVERMMDDPRFIRGVKQFHSQWLHLQNVENYQEKVEMLTFVEHLFSEGDADIKTLLGASYSFVNNRQAEIYGVPPPEEPFGRVELDPNERSGVLTQIAFLSNTGAAYPDVFRGLFVRESLLCDTLGSPPPNAVEENETLQVPRVEHEVCSTCHLYLDPIGHGFDRYDSTGAFRTETADGEEIDGFGEISALRDGNLEGTFETIPELAAMITDSPIAQRCFATQWSRFALRRLEKSQDQCEIDVFGAKVTESGGDLRQLAFDIATSEWFRSRAITDFEAP